MTTDNNPFKAPVAQVADEIPGAGEFIPEGQTVAAGNGVAWISQGWEMFRQAPGTWIGLTVVFLLIAFVISIIPLVQIALNLLMPIFTGGIMIGCQAQRDGEDLRIGHLFAGFSGYAGKLALVGLLYLVGIIALVAVMFVFGFGAGMAAGRGASSVAMILPMLIGLFFMVPLAMAVWYAPALVIFHDVSPFQAMKASFFACLKNFVPFLVYGLVLLVLAFLACLPVFLGLLVLVPVMYASAYASYRDMFIRE